MWFKKTKYYLVGCIEDYINANYFFYNTDQIKCLQTFFPADIISKIKRGAGKTTLIIWYFWYRLEWFINVALQKRKQILKDKDRPFPL